MGKAKKVSEAQGLREAWVGAVEAGMEYQQLFLAEQKRALRLEKENAELIERLRERMDYYAAKSLRNGWTTSESGPCCDKCKMTNPTNPLHVAAGCRNPFQLPEVCECHIPTRTAVRKGIVTALEQLIKKISGPESSMTNPIADKYYELIYAVGNKYPNETRHQTALRYIRNAEAAVVHACDTTDEDRPLLCDCGSPGKAAKRLDNERLK